MISSIRASLLLGRMKLDQWKSTEELEAIQEERLRELVPYARENVPYYKGLQDVRDLEDLRSLPIMEKTDIRGNAESLLSRRFLKVSLTCVKTSGSTGMPLSIYHHPSESHHGPTCEIHMLTECGVSPFDIQVFMAPHGRNHQRFIQRLGLFRRINISALDDERQSLLRLKQMRPGALLCLPSLLVTMAHENLAADLGFSVKRVFSTSEVLRERDRLLMERSFGCRVHDLYGAVETSWICWQCEEGSIHLNSDSMIAEIVDDAGQPVRRGEYGNIVLTQLWKRSMPLIRYRVGDRTAFGTRCRCGRGLHTLKPIEGRSDDFIVLPSGRACHSRFIHWGLRQFEGILLFQAVQEEPGELMLRIVPAGEPLSPKTKDSIKEAIQASLPEKLNLEIQEVDSLPRGRTGKIKAVISRARPSFKP